jgi:predicted SAM-dependent methyltransferase
MLEHLDSRTAERLIADAYRVLRPGGVLRLCVPDLEFAVSRYQEGDRARFLDYFFPLDPRNDLGRHRYMYDYFMLHQLLQSVGFAEVERFARAEGATPDIGLLDNREDETLYVEAVK